LQSACASAPQHAPDQAEVTTASITDRISHLVVAEAVDLDGLRAQLRRTPRASPISTRARRPEPARGDLPFGHWPQAPLDCTGITFVFLNAHQQDLIAILKTKDSKSGGSATPWLQW
jgi:hypothetical protein